VGDLANDHFDGALRRLQIAFEFVLRALFHLISSWLPLTLWIAGWDFAAFPGQNVVDGQYQASEL
jgi:hypothetical protein